MNAHHSLHAPRACLPARVHRPVCLQKYMNAHHSSHVARACLPARVHRRAATTHAPLADRPLASATPRDPSPQTSSPTTSWPSGAPTALFDQAADTEEASVLEGQSCGSFWTNCHGCTSTGDHCGLPSGVGPAKVVCAGPRGTEDDGPTCDAYGADPCDSTCDESFQCENPDNFFSHACEPCLACKGIHSVAFDAQDHPHTLEVKQLHDTQIFGFKCEPGWEGENCNNDTDDCKHHDCSGHGTVRSRARAPRYLDTFTFTLTPSPPLPLSSRSLLCSARTRARSRTRARAMLILQASTASKSNRSAPTSRSPYAP